MTQDQKDLLLQDLSGRIPYGVKMNHIADNEYSPNTLIGIAKDMITLEGLGGYECVDVEHYKPYLFPLSSMTEEIMDEIYNITGVYDIGVDSPIHIEVGTTFEDLTKIFHILNKHHIDYHGLIPMGLAIDATGLGIYP